MKIDTYAHAAIEMVKKGATPKDAVASLSEFLSKKGQVGVLRRLIPVLQKIEIQEQRSGWTVAVAKEGDAHAARVHAKTIADGDVCTIIDPTLIGGWRLVGKNTLVDGSYKKQLLAVYRAATR